jgi:hypothetical protein
LTRRAQAQKQSPAQERWSPVRERWSQMRERRGQAQAQERRSGVQERALAQSPWQAVGREWARVSWHQVKVWRQEEIRYVHATPPTALEAVRLPRVPAAEASRSLEAALAQVVA